MYSPHVQPVCYSSTSSTIYMIVCKQTSGGTTIQSSGSHLAQTKGQPDNNQHKECLGHIARIIHVVAIFNPQFQYTNLPPYVVNYM